MPDALPDLVRCPDCGASNRARASWCGQCLRRFGATMGTSPASSPSQETVAPDRSAPGGPVVRARDGEEPVWACPACDAENPLSLDACALCGSAFTSFFESASAGERVQVSPRFALAFSAVLPGAGHWMYRQVAPAIARALLYLWSVGISILLLARPPSAARSLVLAIGVCFALAAAGIWVLSVLEVMRFGEGDRRPLIPPKALTWLAAGMSSLLFLGLLGAVIAGH